MSREDSCRFCRFYKPESDNDGQCRRYAPRPHVERGTSEPWYKVAMDWATVMAFDWCGDFAKEIEA